MQSDERPIRAESKQTEIAAVNLVTKMFNQFNWAFSESREDLGIDLYVTVCRRQPPRTARPEDFYVQVKGTRHLSEDADNVSYYIKTAHARYWLERPLPVLFLLVDVVTEKIYWLWIQEYLKGISWWEKERIRIKIPKSNCLTEETSLEMRRHVESRVWKSVRSHFRSPTSLSKDERAQVFPYALDDLPHPFVDEKLGTMNVLLITGPAFYEMEILEHRFEKRGNTFIDLRLGNELVLGESAYNIALAAEILGALCFTAGQKGLRIATESGRIFLPYLEVDDDILARHNVILIPCGDVNPWLPTALMHFEMKYCVRCPVHHEPYHTSEKIRSEISGSVYEKMRRNKKVKEEWAGYVLLLPNPWNPKMACLVCGGNMGVGTQAALQRVLRAVREEERLCNNEGLPARVVAAECARNPKMLSGTRDLE